MSKCAQRLLENKVHRNNRSNTIVQGKSPIHPNPSQSLDVPPAVVLGTASKKPPTLLLFRKFVRNSLASDLYLAKEVFRSRASWGDLGCPRNACKFFWYSTWVVRATSKCGVLRLTCVYTHIIYIYIDTLSTQIMGLVSDSVI